MIRFVVAIGISAALLVFLAAASYSDAKAPRQLSTYFPAGQIRANDDADAIYGEKLASALSSMRTPNVKEGAQPSLFVPSPLSAKHEKEYRAIVSRDGEYIMAIRAFQDGGGTPEVVADKIDMHDAGRSENFQRRLSGEDWSKLFRAVDTAGLMRPPHSPANYGGDCPDWVFEAREGARYELMSVTCSNDPAVKTLQNAFMKAAGWIVY